MSAPQLISKTESVQKSMQIGLNLLCFYFLLQEYEVSTIIFLYFIYKWFLIQEFIKKEAGLGCPGCYSDYVLAASEEAESKAPRPWTVCQSLANTVDSPDQTKKCMDSDKWTLSQLYFCHCCQLTAFDMVLIFGCVEGNWNCHVKLCHGSPIFSVKFFHLKKVTFTVNISILKKERGKSVARESMPSVFFPRKSSQGVGDTNGCSPNGF